jgi:hypothetical protein
VISTRTFIPTNFNPSKEGCEEKSPVSKIAHNGFNAFSIEPVPELVVVSFSGIKINPKSGRNWNE